jgi:hypothetical protein
VAPHVQTSEIVKKRKIQMLKCETIWQKQANTNMFSLNTSKKKMEYVSTTWPFQGSIQYNSDVKLFFVFISVIGHFTGGNLI